MVHTTARFQIECALGRGDIPQRSPALAYSYQVGSFKSPDRMLRD